MSYYESWDSVKWECGNGTASGEIQSVFTKSVTRKIKGSEVTRNWSDDNPAYYIKQDDWDAVLKLHSEVEKK